MVAPVDRNVDSGGMRAESVLFAELALVDDEKFFAFLCLEDGIVLGVHKVQLVVHVVP